MARARFGHPTGFGKRLKALRESAGLSQGALAERVGCHRTTIARIEVDVQEPVWSLVILLAKALGVDCNAFMPKGK
jgi:putative transcriptional regulator